MSKTTQVMPATCKNCNILMVAIDARELGRSSVLDLGELFRAIEGASKEYSTARSLAKIGKRLVVDQANILESERERLEELQRKLDARSWSEPSQPRSPRPVSWTCEAAPGLAP